MVTCATECVKLVSRGSLVVQDHPLDTSATERSSLPHNGRSPSPLPPQHTHTWKVTSTVFIAVSNRSRCISPPAPGRSLLKAKLLRFMYISCSWLSSLQLLFSTARFTFEEYEPEGGEGREVDVGAGSQNSEKRFVHMLNTR